MVGLSSRLIILLSTPLSLLHHRPSTLLRLARRHSLPPLSAVRHHHLHLPPSRANSLFPIKSSRRFHSQAAGNSLQESNFIPADAYSVPPSHPWPEWSELLGSLSNAGYFVGNSSIEDEFVANESLSMEFVAAASSCLCFARDRPDILGWLPKKDIQVLVDEGTPFLFKNTLEIERRMRSFLQAEKSNEARTVDLMKYILSYASNPIIYPERNIKEAAESSARNLLREMANLSGRGPVSHMSAPEQFQAAGQDEQTPRNLGPNITMKRGDWVCPKCSFMNFARNTKCLECEELRPQRQLTGGEWDCPQCNFFNYRRNTVCLKCECKRPGETPFPGSPGQGKTPSDRQLINSQYQNNFGDNGNPDGNNFWGSNKNLETSSIHNLDQFRINTSTVPGTYTKSIDGGQNARRDSRPPIPKGNNSSYVPFVPLPADMFAKKPEKTTVEDSNKAAIRSPESLSLTVSDPTSTVSVSNEPVKGREDSQWSEKSATNVESQIKDANEEEKSERWFKKVAELHDATDLASAISDEDFPQIMPMRKGENRFVVSKKKDRSLTSSTYKRQQAMEQGNNSNFVPFVPFPPDYFAKKDDKQQSKSTDSTVKPTDETSSPENSNNATRDMNLVQERATQGTSSTDNLSSRSSVDNTVVNSYSTQINRKETSPESQTSNVVQQAPENRSGWTGKSLEGSAVKETDPLDMSEEAKAERWFRRVAQIKDISELSQIPDEDFPSIMPMRKGVNRFVVSKRKTPLERRLTSPEYRKNLRTMSSDPIKKEDDGN